MSALTDFHTTRRVQIVVVPVPCICEWVTHVSVMLEHGTEPDVSLPRCSRCGTPMEPMRDDVIDCALYCVTHGEV